MHSGIKACVAGRPAMLASDSECQGKHKSVASGIFAICILHFAVALAAKAMPKSHASRLFPLLAFCYSIATVFFRQLAVLARESLSFDVNVIMVGV